MRSWLLLLVCASLATLPLGCSVIVSSQIDDNAADSGVGPGCSNDDDCLDTNECNGVETCNTATSACVPGTRPPEGSECVINPAAPSDIGICVAEVCDFSTCGDGFTDPANDEECDDANDIPDDGCENDCFFTCVDAADCEDDFPCDGDARCNANRCDESFLPPPGTSCSTPSLTDGMCNTDIGQCCNEVEARCCDADDNCT